MSSSFLRGLTAVIGVLVFHLTVLPSAGAQEAFADLNGKLRPGDVLIVTDTNGGRTTGSLVELTATSLLIFADGERRGFDVDEIRRIQRRRNGVLLGAIIGAAAGGALAALGAALEDGGDYNAFASIAWPVALGTGLGVGIDALLVVPRTVYRRPDRGAAVAPFIAPAGAGVRVAVRF